MSDEKRKKHDDDCDEEECLAVKGCKRGRPVKVRLEDDCDPIPVRIEEKHCEPLRVRIKQEHCEPLIVKQKKDDCWHVQGCEHGLPVKTEPAKGHCWPVEGCPDGTPVNVHVTNPFPASDNNQFVFNGHTWEPELTPNKFVPLNNVGVNGSQVVWQPAPGSTFRLMSFEVSSTLAGQLNFRDGVGGPVIYSLVVSAGVPYQSCDLGNGILSTTAGNPLVLEVVAGPGPTSFISGMIVGQEV
jgi:hypothetical protein